MLPSVPRSKDVNMAFASTIQAKRDSDPACGGALIVICLSSIAANTIRKLPRFTFQNFQPTLSTSSICLMASGTALLDVINDSACFRHKCRNYRTDILSEYASSV